MEHVLVRGDLLIIVELKEHRVDVERTQKKAPEGALSKSTAVTVNIVIDLALVAVTHLVNYL